MVESERFQVYRKGQINKKEETRDKMRFLRRQLGRRSRVRRDTYAS